MFARGAVLAAAVLSLVSAAPPAVDFHPWVIAESEFGASQFPSDRAAELVLARISIAELAFIESRILHESRGRSDLDLFYERHLVEPSTALVVLARRGTESVVACSVAETYVSANIFAPNGRIDARTCLVDAEADGVFDEIRWSASQIEGHFVHSFRVLGFDPPLTTSTPYRRSMASVGTPPYLNVTIAYDPDDGFVRGVVTTSDGVVLVRDRQRLPRPNARPQQFEFFGFVIALERVAPESFSWRAVRKLPEQTRFLLSYDYRR